MTRQRYVPAAENRPGANDPMQEPVDADFGGSVDEPASYDPVGMVRCRSCGMWTPGSETRCERCNSPVRV